jgi:hypothetical protein
MWAVPWLRKDLFNSGISDQQYERAAPIGGVGFPIVQIFAQNGPEHTMPRAALIFEDGQLPHGAAAV